MDDETIHRIVDAIRDGKAVHRDYEFNDNFIVNSVSRFIEYLNHGITYRWFIDGMEVKE